ncbi:MAG: hypothetical protein [Caudoviricetes sp.]|nr:MAG: hypothetical protein [Caudoviricetes sp.]
MKTCNWIWALFIVLAIWVGPDISTAGDIYWAVFGGIGLFVELCHTASFKFCESKVCKLFYGCEIPYWFSVLLAGVALFGFHPIACVYGVVAIRAVVVKVASGVSDVR